MRRFMSSGLVTLVAATALAGVGCKARARDDSQVSASKQVEQAQQESKDAYDRAKKAQDKALDEQREAAKAEDKVNDKRQELNEAEANAAKQAQEAQTAQEEATREGESAHGQAQHAQERAAQLQQQQQTDQTQQTTEPAATTSTAQARTSDTTRVQTRSAQSSDRNPDVSWMKSSGAWNSAPTGQGDGAAANAPQNTAQAAKDAVNTASNTAAATMTVLDNAQLRPVSANEIMVQTSDDKSVHVLNAKVDANTKITKDGNAATLSDLKEGDHAKVSYRLDRNQPVATSIEITSQGQ